MYYIGILLNYIYTVVFKSSYTLYTHLSLSQKTIVGTLLLPPNHSSALKMYMFCTNLPVLIRYVHDFILFYFIDINIILFCNLAQTLTTNPNLFYPILLNSCSLFYIVSLFFIHI